MKKTIELLKAVIAAAYVVAVVIAILFGMFVMAAIAGPQIFVVKLAIAIGYVACVCAAVFSAQKFLNILS